MWYVLSLHEEGENTRKKIFIIVISMLCTLVSFNTLSVPVQADSNTKFITAIYGSFPIGSISPVPNFFHNVSGVILNTGKVSAYNVSCTITITGGFKKDINKTISYNNNELPSLRWMVVGLEGTYGFGPVKITLIVLATNAITKTRMAKGFKIGGFTWIPLSWFIPGILQNFIPWLSEQPE